MKQHWQLADGTPNWELYPDATHYCPETHATYECFLKSAGHHGEVYFVAYGTPYLEWEYSEDPGDLDDTECFIAK